MFIRLTASLLFILLFNSVNAQNDYSNFYRQTDRVKEMAKSYPQFVKTNSIVKTDGGKDIWQITIGTGNTSAKPAIAVIGGVQGNHLLGTELALGFAETLLQNSNKDSIKNLLDKTTFYIFPNMSPDAMEQYFASIKYERQGNASDTDDDRDGSTNEDGYDDLDGNGKITYMRVHSPIGDYRTHPEDERVMVKINAGKPEKGSYKIYTEGRDNDKDEMFNEDGAGGVWFNKNFSYKHPSFTEGAGEFPVSENENRALLDLLYEQFNIYAVISFGGANNLSTPNTYNAPAASQRIVASWMEADAKQNAAVSELYNKITGLKDAPKTKAEGGDFGSWAYYHYGRYSFSTPGWWVPKTKPDSTKNEKAFSVEDSVANYLRWTSQQGIAPAFTPWKAIDHPDFPGQKVEVGGPDPFVLINPPYNMVADLVKKHSEFITKFAAMQPELDVVNVKTEKVSPDLTRITIDVINKGALASHSKIGERNYWVKRINVKLNLNNNQSLVSGKKNHLLNALEGYSSEKISWLIKGSGKVNIEAGSPTTGIKKIDIPL